MEAKHKLSRVVYEWEEGPDFDEEAWLASAHPLDDHPLEHPDVTALAAEYEDGPAGALAYLSEGATSDAPAVIRWMRAGGYKGHFESDAEFCRDQFADAIADHMESWTGSQEIGFPVADVCWSDAIDWEEIAYRTVGGPVMDTDDQVFYSIDVDSGVHVFDMSVPFRESEDTPE